ncbi:MAG: hypothetical protein WCD79_22880 [Chthoniobacteraceae bacterium]
MKINRTRHINLITTAAMTCLQAISCIQALNCSANAAPKKALPCAEGNSSSMSAGSKSNLDEAARANHNSLVPASFYESNHAFSGS